MKREEWAEFKRAKAVREKIDGKVELMILQIEANEFIRGAPRCCLDRDES